MERVFSRAITIHCSSLAWSLVVVEMLRRMVRKAVQASKSLPGAEIRGSGVLTVFSRSGIDIALENASGNQWRLLGNHHNFTFKSCGDVRPCGDSALDLLHKHGAEENFRRCLYTRARQHNAGSPSITPGLYSHSPPSSVDGSKSKPSKGVECASSLHVQVCC